MLRDLKEIKSNIRELLKKGEISKAIKSMSENFEGSNDLVVVSSRFSRAKRDYSIGIISLENYDLKINKIVFGILNVLDTYVEEDLKYFNKEYEKSSNFKTQLPIDEDVFFDENVNPLFNIISRINNILVHELSNSGNKIEITNIIREMPEICKEIVGVMTKNKLASYLVKMYLFYEDKESVKLIEFASSKREKIDMDKNPFLHDFYPAADIYNEGLKSYINNDTIVNDYFSPSVSDELVAGSELVMPFINYAPSHDHKGVNFGFMQVISDKPNCFDREVNTKSIQIVADCLRIVVLRMYDYYENR